MAERAVRQEEADQDEDSRLGEGRQVLGLAVPVRVRTVRRPDGNAHGEESEERRDEISARVDRFREQSEAVRREAGR